jgi:hypothetical protein
MLAPPTFSADALVRDLRDPGNSQVAGCFQQSSNVGSKNEALNPEASLVGSGDYISSVLNKYWKQVV